MAAASAGGAGVPELGLVLQRLGLADSDVAACYVTGSHAWGLANKHSDLDLVVVLRGAACKRDIHAGNIDACIVSGERWKRRKMKKRKRKKKKKNHDKG